LLVVLRFLTQPGSQYIFAPFAVAPIGELYLGRSAHCACCRRSWSIGNGGGLLRTCCSTPWDSSSCLSAPYLRAWTGLHSPGACGGGEPSPGADVGGGEPSPGADVTSVRTRPIGAEGRPAEPGVLTLTKTDGVDLRGDYAAPRAPASSQTLPY
jgi:hypothetical protein